IAREVPNLALANLLRGWRMRLPSGQSIARAMGIEPLADDKILIGATSEGPARTPITEISEEFEDNCPLWAYILAETDTAESDMEIRVVDGPPTLKVKKLGPVGGRIVAETIVGLLMGDGTSYLNRYPKWQPSLGKGGPFGLRELIKAALE